MSNRSIFKRIQLFLILPLLGIIGWQQWLVFSKFQDSFLNFEGYLHKVQPIDDIAGYKTKLAEVRKMFSGRSKLTYASETIHPNEATREMHFALTQYELAPNLLFRNALTPDNLESSIGAAPPTYTSTVYDTVIYNLYCSFMLNPQNNYYLNNGYHVVKDFGNGIIILAK